MNVNIICLGKLKEEYLRKACDEYTKRLGAFCTLKITEITPERLPDNPPESLIEAALEKEGEKIMKYITANDAVIALCIEGKEFSSEELAAKIDSITLGGKSTVDFIIGSSYGLSPAVKAKADIRLSMSRMTFPHQLARVMCLEQIYRAFMISSGGKYHK